MLPKLLWWAAILRVFLVKWALETFSYTCHKLASNMTLGFLGVESRLLSSFQFPSAPLLLMWSVLDPISYSKKRCLARL